MYRSVSRHHCLLVLQIVADEQYDPVKKLLILERQLAVLEQKHGITSPEFFQRYQAGAMGDSVEFVSWAGLKLVDSESHLMPA